MCENNEIFTQDPTGDFCCLKKCEIRQNLFSACYNYKKIPGAYTDNAFCPKHHIDSGERKV